MKKIIAMLLCAVMLLSVLTACADAKLGSSETGTISGKSVDNSAREAIPTLAAALNGKKYDLTPKPLCEEKQTLRICTYDGVNSTYPPPSNDQWFWQALEEYTNVHIEWDISPVAGYDEVVNTRLAAGVNLADIMMCNGVKSAKNAGDNGVFIDLKPYWDSCFTNTKTYCENIGQDILPYITNPNGKIYTLPNILNPVEGHITFMYNTQWLKDLGAEVPTTLDEFTELMHQMKNAGDLNHNGYPDEICLTSSNVTTLLSVLGNAFNLEQYEGWDAFDADENGVVHDEYTSDNMKACLTYLNQLYNEGILDREISFMGADELGEKIANDRVGCFVYFSGFAIGYGRLTTLGQEDPLAECYTLGMPLASEWNNNEGFFVRRQFAYGNTGAAITSECSDPELAAKWLDVLYADPNILWARTYGKEGETYQFDENGNMQLICTDAGDWNAKDLGCGQITLPFIQTTEELLSDKIPYAWYQEEYEAMRNCKWINASVPKTNIFSEEEEELRDEVFSETNSYWMEWRDKFITGLADINTEWDTFVPSIRGIGMDQMTQVWTMVNERMTTK